MLEVIFSMIFSYVPWQVEMDTQLQYKDDQIQRQATELRERTLQLNRQLREVQTLQAEVEAKWLATELRERTLQLNRQLREVQRLQAEVEAKDAEIDRQQRELQTLRVKN